MVPWSPDPARTLLREQIRASYGVARTRPEAHAGGTEAWIHDARVGMRRLETALSLLAPALASKRRSAVLGRAQRFRRRLGRSRELDVVVEELHGLAIRLGVPASELEPLQKRIDKRQRKTLAQVRAHYTRSRLTEHRRRALRLKPQPEWPLADLVATHVYDACESAALRVRWLDDPEAVDQHHRLRIRIKRLRYALELAEPQVGPEADVRSLLKQLKKYQDGLGRLNDAVDLVQFVGQHRLPGPGPKAWHHEARVVQDERHRFARGLVRQNLPELLGRIRRAAGRTGRIELRR